MTTTRQKILEESIRIITADREKEYGPPEDSFAEIAEYWDVYLRLSGVIGGNRKLAAGDTGIMMALFKIARMHHAYKVDNYIDAAGYIAIAGGMGPIHNEPQG